MKKVNQFLNDYRVLIYIITIVGFMFVYIKLPQRVDALEQNDVVLDDVDEEIKSAVDKLANTVENYVSGQSIKEKFWEKRELKQDQLIEKLTEITISNGS